MRLIVTYVDANGDTLKFIEVAAVVPQKGDTVEIKDVVYIVAHLHHGLGGGEHGVDVYLLPKEVS